jgi:hypothetical protein
MAAQCTRRRGGYKSPWSSGERCAILSGVAGPYRARLGAEVLEAPTRDGLARLSLEPHRCSLEVAGRFVATISVSQVAVTDCTARVPTPRVRPLTSASIWISMGFPTDEVGLWYAETPATAQRLAGLRPPELLDQAALDAWRQLARLGDRLRRATEVHCGGVERAVELGRGGHRVLLAEYDGRLVLYARPLFRERPRRVLEVRRDGAVLVPARGRDLLVRCRGAHAVSVLGDRLRFEGVDGARVSVLLPWIAAEDRAELARRFAAALAAAPAARARDAAAG